MSATKIALLGAIAGFTIFLGLPIGRLKNPAPRLRAMLNAGAVGILVFLLWDVLAHAWEPVDAALGKHDYAPALGNGLVLAAGLGVGLLGLVYFDRWVATRGRTGTATAPTAAPVATPAADPAAAPAADPATTPAPVPAATPAALSAATPTTPSTGAPATLSASAPTASSTNAPAALQAGGGASHTPAPTAAAPEPAARRGAAGQLALMIAVGIGLHNFAEGLAIGNSAASGEIALALLLIIGFGLHNATEGFGIVAPLAAAGVRPSWGYLAALGLIGGGPTLLGTLVGQSFTNDTLSIAFLALAAGSILYVVIELLAVGRRMGVKEITTWGLLIGLLAGFLTDAIVTAGGA